MKTNRRPKKQKIDYESILFDALHFVGDDLDKDTVIDELKRSFDKRTFKEIALAFDRAINEIQQDEFDDEDDDE